MMDLTRQYELMALIRHTEIRLLELFSKGELNGTVHTCIGQEACAVGVVTAADKEKDIFYSNHRGHGHYLAYTEDLKGIIAEIMGRPEGVCGGIGGSQHLQRQNYYSNGIQGAGVPVVAGMALAEKLKGTDAVATVFIGDGTFGEGVIYEAFNIASLWELPMLIVVEHNRYAQSTPTYDQHAGNLERRAEPFDIPVTVVDGMRVDLVHEAASRIFSEIRQNGRPQMLFLNTYRFAPHSKGDDHRDVEEIDEYRKLDPLVWVESQLGKEVSDSLMLKANGRVDEVIRELTA